MIDSDQFKDHATRFRRRAKKMGFEFQLTTLLDIYSYAHYGLPYNAMRSRGWVPEPEFPPPYLEEVAAEYETPADRILEALEGVPMRDPAPEPPEEVWTAEEFRLATKHFRDVAPTQGIRLKMTAANDLYSRMYFDRPYAEVMGSLRDGEPLRRQPDPDYLDAACALFGVDVRKAHATLWDMFMYSAE
jgi:hypothetical protein